MPTAVARTWLSRGCNRESDAGQLAEGVEAKASLTEAHLADPSALPHVSAAFIQRSRHSQIKVGWRFSSPHLECIRDAYNMTWIQVGGQL